MTTVDASTDVSSESRVMHDRVSAALQLACNLADGWGALLAAELTTADRDTLSAIVGRARPLLRLILEQHEREREGI